MNKNILKLIYKKLRDSYLSYQFPREAGYSYFRGVFETFEQAIQTVPKSKFIGYNSSDLAEEYISDTESFEAIRAYDYPMLFWLKHIFDNTDEDISVFDFGGNVGIHFYAYQKYIKYPKRLKWIVFEVPEIAKVGRKLAAVKLTSNLEFTDIENVAEDKDVFIASGSVQYVKSLSTLLASLIKKPRFLLLNRLPLYNGDQFVTLQNGGKVFYPQYVFNYSNFILSLEKIGYELIDVWEDNIDSCIIPFHPEKSIRFYHGFHFKLRL
jgi:putative methyltransferase (TIGR04325 family)